MKIIYLVKNYTQRIMKFNISLLLILVVIFYQISGAQVPVQGANLNALAEAQKQLTMNKNYTEAARIFYQVASQSDPNTKPRAEMGLAESLRAANLPFAAAYFYLRIVSQGVSHSFFRQAFDSLATINARTPLGKATIGSLFSGKSKIESIAIPPGTQGFYFFYKGLDAYEKSDATTAKSEFLRVPSNSPYYIKAQYYLGVLGVILKDTDGAIRAFSSVVNAARSRDNESIRQLSIMGLGRVYYERKEIKRSFDYYSRIPRNSDLWLDALFEGAWAFFLIQKNNNTLGNIHTIHSPYFKSRFYPESYILNAITYLKLCYFDKVKINLDLFKQRYNQVANDLATLLTEYKGRELEFFKFISDYKKAKSLSSYKQAVEIVDSISRSDGFKEAVSVVNGMTRERSLMKKRYEEKWAPVGLSVFIEQSYAQRDALTRRLTGLDLYSQAVQKYKYLADLFDQIKLIELERVTSQTDQLRSKFNNESFQTAQGEWGEGMKALDLKKELEYWPFEGEYWEDELGGYVYNIASKCGEQNSTTSKSSSK